MPLIAVCNLKGGVGKTATAAALGAAAHNAGAKTVCVDCDPMHGLGRWAELAELAGTTFEPTVIGMPTSDLPRRLRGALADDVQIAVLDSPPPGNLAVVRGVIEVADLVVMPSSPLISDLDRLRATVGEIGRSVRQPPALAVLTMTRPTADRQSAREALDAWRIPAFRTELPMRVEVARMYGQPVTGVLAAFGADLLAEALDALGVR